MKMTTHYDKIVVLRAIMLGDFIISLPALYSLRKHYPDAHITLLAREWNVDFAKNRNLPFDRVIAIPESKGVNDPPGFMVNDTIVTNTGDDLDSDTRVNTRSDIFVRSSNRMSSEQHVSSHSNSGWNDAMDNIGGNSSSLMSGNAGMNSGASVMGNLNTTFLGSMWDSFMSMFN